MIELLWFTALALFTAACFPPPSQISGSEMQAVLSSSGSAGIPCMAQPKLHTCPCCVAQEAVDKGWFRKERELTRPGSAIPNTETILATALDIAEGVAFLHAQGVVHGDLTGGT